LSDSAACSGYERCLFHQSIFLLSPEKHPSGREAAESDKV
jgi:hypothetical protein